jgi:hypothetical protein
MSHIEGHPVIDQLYHTFERFTGKSKPADPPNSATEKQVAGGLSLQDTHSISHQHHKKGIQAYENWEPFKSVKTGAAVGAMSGVIVGTVAGFASAAAVGLLGKDPKTALIVGGTVFATSIGTGAITGAVGYKVRSMNIDLTEPPMGSLYDTPAQARENMKKADEVWQKALQEGMLK